MTSSYIETLRSQFGLDEFRPGQVEIIEAMMRGDNVMAIMPTGGGKSLCYQLPAVLGDGLTIVVSPLISLMVDQVQALRARGLAAGGIFSGMSSAERSSVHKALATRDGHPGKGCGLKILYVSPERFSYENFTERLAGIKIAFFIIDEAHCVSQWGHDFRPEYSALGGIARRLRATAIGAFTATATPEVRRDIEVQLGIEGASYFFTGFDRENLALEVLSAPTKVAKLNAVVRILRETPGPAIVYCSTRKDTEHVASDLARTGLSVVRYHAGLSDAERDESQKLFIAGKTRVIVATCAFGMGIDKADIRSIIHYSIPGSVEAYYQEIGRSGRDGARARCVLLWAYPDVAIRTYLIKKSDNGGRSASLGEKSPELMAAELRRLKKMCDYAQGNQCRRSYIIDYFSGRHILMRCGMCDRCGSTGATLQHPTAFSVDVALHSSQDKLGMSGPETQTTEARSSEESLEWARKVLACIERVHRAGAPATLRVVDAVLRGSRIADVTSYELTSLSTWDILPGWKRKEVTALFSVLRSKRLMVLGEDKTVVLTDLGRSVMFGKSKIEIPFEREVVTGTLIIEQAEQPDDVGAPNDPQQAETFERLRDWRRKRAKEENVPAYVIAPDKTLTRIASLKSRPVDRETLLTVKGIGPAKIEKYGEEILRLVNMVTRSAAEDFGLAPVGDGSESVGLHE